MPTLAELWDQLHDRDHWPPPPERERRAFSRAEIAALAFTPGELASLFWKPGDAAPLAGDGKRDEGR